MKKCIKIPLITVCLLTTTAQYGMFRRISGIRGPLAKYRAYSTQIMKPKAFHLTPKYTLNKAGEKVVYSPELQLLDLAANSKEGDKRIEDALTLKLDECMTKAQEDYDLHMYEWAKEFENEGKLLDALPKGAFNYYLETLKKETAEESHDVIYAEKPELKE